MKRMIGVVLAAGRSTIHGLSKPLYEINGRAMVEHAIAAQLDADLQTVVVVANPFNQRRIEDLATWFEGRVKVVVQPERRGTADALQWALQDELAEQAAHCLVSLSDMPFWQPNTIRDLAATHIRSRKPPIGSLAAIWHASHDNFRRYGRIFLTDDHIPTRIEDHSTNIRRSTTQGGWVSPGLWCLTIDQVRPLLPLCPEHPNRDRADLPAELYLSDLVELAHEKGKPFQIFHLNGEHTHQAIGIDTARDLAHSRDPRTAMVS